MSHALKAACLSLALFACGVVAKSDTIVIQLGSGSLSLGGGIPDQVQESGAIINPNLTLGTPVNQNFYTPIYTASSNCTGCTGTLTGNLTGNLVVTDQTVSGTGTGTFSQSFSDAISGSTHTFTPQASSAININLSNGDTLVITPSIGTGVGVTAGNTNNSTSASATFLLEKTPTAVPEPSSLLLLLSGAGVAGLWAMRKRRVQA